MAIRALQQCLPLAVLKPRATPLCHERQEVATVLTACGIETAEEFELTANFFGQLQQCLPLAVLKRHHVQ